MDANNAAQLGKLVLTVALRNLPIEKDKDFADLMRCLIANKTRDAVYNACVVMCTDDPERRKPLYHFMLMTLPGLPPSRNMLGAIDNMLKAHLAESGTDVQVPCELINVVRQQLAQRPFEHVLRSAAAFNRENPNVNARAHYLAMYGLQSLACEDDRRSLCDFKEPSTTDERADMAALPKGNRGVTVEIKPITAPPCTDYVNQMPLECTRRTIEQQLDVLENLWDASPQNMDLVRATLFLAKQMCDGYVSKMAFGPPHHLFRSVTVCYLPMLLKWMSSDYMYVRKNVYDFLLTLSLHFQVVDTRGTQPGCSEALQNELLWLLFNVLRRQALTVPYDQMTWSAAAKCALAIVPRCYRHLIDVRALLQFLLLPDLAERHPSTFGVLVEAFSRSLLADKRVGVRPCDNLALDEKEFAKLGSSALSDMVALYRQSTTVLARAAMFHLLFAYAAHKMQECASEKKQPLSTSAIRDAFQALEQLDMPWYVHSLVVYQSSRASDKLHSTVAGHLQNSDLYGCYDEVSHIVHIITGVIAQDTHLPPFVSEMPTEDVLTAIPPLLKQDSDAHLYSMAGRLALLAIRRAAVPSGHRGTDADADADADAGDTVHTLARSLVACPEANSDAERALVRRLCPDLLGALLLLGRSHPDQVAEALPVLLEAYLFSPDSRLSVPCLMTLYYHILESLTMRRGAISTCGRLDWDVSDLLERGLVVCPINAMKSVGSRVLWALYMGLRGDQAQTVCRARHVLASLLTTFGQCTSLRIWQYVKSDPFPLVALIGAEKVDAISKAAPTAGIP